jgi:hypothetical protein
MKVSIKFSDFYDRGQKTGDTFRIVNLYSVFRPLSSNPHI